MDFLILNNNNKKQQREKYFIFRKKQLHLNYNISALSNNICKAYKFLILQLYKKRIGNNLKNTMLSVVTKTRKQKSGKRKICGKLNFVFKNV